MRSISVFLFFAVLCATSLGTVHADLDRRVGLFASEQAAAVAAEDAVPIIKPPRRSVTRQPSTQSQASSLKSSFRASRSAAAAAAQDNDVQDYYKKRVRFFLQEDGDLNILDTHGNEYVSNDEEDDVIEQQAAIAAGSENDRLVASPVEERFDLLHRALREDRQHRLQYQPSVGDDADDTTPTLRQMMERLQERQQQRPSVVDLAASTVPGSIMDYKRRIASRIRTVESKIEYLFEMITEQKQERADVARYNLTRLKLGDYHKQKHIRNARIKLLKEELERQQDELAYYEEEMVLVQQRLHSALLRSQRASQAAIL